MAEGCQYILLGLQVTSQLQNVTAVWEVLNDAAFDSTSA